MRTKQAFLVDVLGRLNELGVDYMLTKIHEHQEALTRPFVELAHAYARKHWGNVRAA